jgi:hypothetical protein
VQLSQQAHRLGDMKAFAAVLLCALAVVGCTAPAPPPILAGSPPPVATSPQGPSLAPVLPSSPPIAPPSPTPSSSAASSQLVCGRIEPAACLEVEALVRQELPFAAQATAIVMDYVCQPGDLCKFSFAAVVSIVVPRDPAVDYAYWPPTYSVTGTSGPSTLQPWNGPLPGTFATLLRSAGFSG